MHFVYHPDHGSKLVNSVEYNQYLINGWYDTPAKFPVIEDDGETVDCNLNHDNNVKRARGRPPK